MFTTKGLKKSMVDGLAGENRLEKEMRRAAAGDGDGGLSGRFVGKAKDEERGSEDSGERE